MTPEDSTTQTDRAYDEGTAATMPDDQCLIDTETQEEVTVVGPVLNDGRVLVQKAAGGLLDVIDVKRLKPMPSS